MKKPTLSVVEAAPLDAVSPPPSEAAPNAPPKGGGAGRTGQPGQPGAQSKKPRKLADWGKVNTLLEHFSLIYGTDTVWDDQAKRIMKVGALRLAWGNDEVKMWLGSRERKQILVEDLVFEPGCVIRDGQVNMWRGFDIQPLACDDREVEPMISLLRHLCSTSATSSDGVEELVEWVLCWQALPLQKPGAKMQTSIVMHGPQGTGKNLYWDAWRDLFGHYGVTVSQTELEDKFNSWLSCKLAIVGDEVVSRQEMYHNKNRLKLVVTTAKKFPIRAMMQDTRWESNHANVVFLSNESQPLVLEMRDRRYLVVYTPLADDNGLYERVKEFLENDGLRKWMYYLKTYPLGDFAEHTKPITTEPKERLIELGLKPAQRFMAEWLDGLLPLPMHVCSGAQLYTAFQRWADKEGERYCPNRPAFTLEAERYVLEHVERDEKGRRVEPRLTYKMVQLQRAGLTERKSARCWIPRGTGPKEGITVGAWVAACVDSFEPVLERFLRRTGEVDGN
jgi:putative DNA primase/helicase